MHVFKKLFSHIIAFQLLSFGMCDEQVVQRFFIEGNDANLHFRHNVTKHDNCGLTIDGNDPSNHQHRRFHHNIKEDGLKLKIFNISRHDSGMYEYACFAKATFVKVNIIVKVLFPPSKAICHFHETDFDSHAFLEARKVWQILKCSANFGSGISLIACYQNGTILPLLDYSKNQTTVVTKIWSRKQEQVSCCSYDMSTHIAEAECDDFIHYPGYKMIPKAAHDLTTESKLYTNPTESHPLEETNPSCSTTADALHLMIVSHVFVDCILLISLIVNILFIIHKLAE